MKIIAWNLKNIGQTKLSNNFNPLISAAGLGNNVLDYMMNVVMGAAVWNNAMATTNPVDVFVVIELKTGGKGKGKAVSGTCTPTLNTILAQMNARAGNLGVAANYHYTAVTPLITGYHEAVGIIYNDRRFTLQGSAVLRDTTNNAYLSPRTPFVAEFRINNTNPVQTFRVIGIHAPPPSGGAALRYKRPIDFCRQLNGVQGMNLPVNFLLGDFNCNPASSYTNAFGVAYQPFTNLNGYGTPLPNNTLSSVRKTIVPTNPQPSNYLADAYDNIIFNFVTGPNDERVIDLIGNARDVSVNPAVPLYPARIRALVNNYWAVSDHLPVALEF